MMYFALALGPVVFLFTLIYLADRYEREPLKYLIITYLLGIFIAAPVVMLGNYLSHVLGVDGTIESGVWRIFVYAFVVVALTEEGMKYLILRYYNYPHKEFDEPYDGIMYAVAGSLGFASIENLLYLATAEDMVATGLLRMFTAVPAHAVFGVLMGYHVGRAKFIHADARDAWAERIKGLLIALFFHGAYDFFLFLGNEYLVALAFVALIWGAVLAIRAVRIHASLSPYKTEGEPDA